MRRPFFLIATLILVFSSLIAAGTTLATAHQDTSDGANPLAGTTIEVLSSGEPADTPGKTLMLMRVTMEPGAAIPPHFHPGPVALSVAEGEFGTEFFKGTGAVTRAASQGTPGPTIEMKPGDNITMQVGDHLFYDGAVHTMRNDGDGTLVLLVSALFTNGQPGFNFVNMGTPTS